MKRVQSFGAGVQSTALLRLILAGKVAPVDLVIFADTGAEPKHVYGVVEREAKLCRKAGIPFDIVSWRNILTNAKTTLPPLFTLAPNGKKGAMWRQCTQDYKVTPIRRRIREVFGKEQVELLLGISTDEITRVKPSQVAYIVNAFPLIDLNMSRTDCQAYLDGLGVTAAKSACIICPYSDTATWQRIRSAPDDWRKAVAYDKKIRHAMASRADVQCYVHPSCLPLPEAVDQAATDGFDAECEGLCGL